MALDDQLCFALYVASHAVISRYLPILDEFGLSALSPADSSDVNAGSTTSVHFRSS